MLPENIMKRMTFVAIAGLAAIVTFRSAVGAQEPTQPPPAAESPASGTPAR